MKQRVPIPHTSPALLEQNRKRINSDGVNSREDNNARTAFCQLDGNPFKTKNISAIHKLHTLAKKLNNDCYLHKKSSTDIIRDFLFGIERIRGEL